jgi:hypothetical protein
MPTISFTPQLGLALPTTGDLTGTWGFEVNNAITSLTDSAIAGTATLSADSDVTLTFGNGVVNQARNAVILWVATGTVQRTITAPAKSKIYVVINATGGTQSIKLVGTGPTTGITIAAGERCVAAWNGSDFVKVATNTVDGVSNISFGTTGLTPSAPTDGSVVVAGTLVAANGGTGQSTYSVGDLLYATGATALSKLGIGAASQILASTGAAPQWTDPSSITVGNATNAVNSTNATNATNATTATNLAGGAANQITYQSGASTSAFAVAPTIPGTVLGWNGSAFAWVAAPAAVTASALAGGVASQIPYQTAPGVTAFIPNGTAGQILVSNGASAPTWQAETPILNRAFVYFCAQF